MSHQLWTAVDDLARDLIDRRRVPGALIPNDIAEFERLAQYGIRIDDFAHTYTLVDPLNGHAPVPGIETFIALVLVHLLEAATLGSELHANLATSPPSAHDVYLGEYLQLLRHRCGILWRNKSTAPYEIRVHEILKLLIKNSILFWDNLDDIIAPLVYVDGGSFLLKGIYEMDVALFRSAADVLVSRYQNYPFKYKQRVGKVFEKMASVRPDQQVYLRRLLMEAGMHSEVVLKISTQPSVQSTVANATTAAPRYDDNRQNVESALFAISLLTPNDASASNASTMVMVHAVDPILREFAKELVDSRGRLRDALKLALANQDLFHSCVLLRAMCSIAYALHNFAPDGNDAELISMVCDTLDKTMPDDICNSNDADLHRSIRMFTATYVLLVVDPARNSEHAMALMSLLLYSNSMAPLTAALLTLIYAVKVPSVCEFIGVALAVGNSNKLKIRPERLQALNEVRVQLMTSTRDTGNPANAEAALMRHIFSARLPDSIRTRHKQPLSHGEQAEIEVMVEAASAALNRDLAVHTQTDIRPWITQRIHSSSLDNVPLLLPVLRGYVHSFARSPSIAPLTHTEIALTFDSATVGAPQLLTAFTLLYLATTLRHHRPGAPTFNDLRHRLNAASYPDTVMDSLPIKRVMRYARENRDIHPALVKLYPDLLAMTQSCCPELGEVSGLLAEKEYGGGGSGGGSGSGSGGGSGAFPELAMRYARAVMAKAGLNNQTFGLTSALQDTSRGILNLANMTSLEMTRIVAAAMDDPEQCKVLFRCIGEQLPLDAQYRFAAPIVAAASKRIVALCNCGNNSNAASSHHLSTVLDEYHSLWMRLCSVASGAVQLATANAFRPASESQSALFSTQDLWLDPLLLFRSDPIVFKVPELLAIFLHCLRTYLAMARSKVQLLYDKWRVRCHDLQQQQIHSTPLVIPENAVNKMLMLQETGALQMLLEIAMRQQPTVMPITTTATVAVVDESLTVSGAAVATNSIGHMIFDYIHDVFVSRIHLSRALMLQTIPTLSIPLVVEHVPSMHTAIDFIPDLVADVQNVDRAAFGFKLARALIDKYPMQHAIDMMRDAVMPNLPAFVARVAERCTVQSVIAAALEAVADGVDIQSAANQLSVASSNAAAANTLGLRELMSADIGGGSGSGGDGKQTPLSAASLKNSEKRLSLWSGSEEAARLMDVFDNLETLIRRFKEMGSSVLPLLDVHFPARQSPNAALRQQPPPSQKQSNLPPISQELRPRLLFPSSAIRLVAANEGMPVNVITIAHSPLQQLYDSRTQMFMSVVEQQYARIVKMCAEEMRSWARSMQSIVKSQPGFKKNKPYK